MELRSSITLLGWATKTEGAKRAGVVVDTQREAIDRARDQAKREHVDLDRCRSYRCRGSFHLYDGSQPRVSRCVSLIQVNTAVFASRIWTYNKPASFYFACALVDDPDRVIRSKSNRRGSIVIELH